MAEEKKAEKAPAKEPEKHDAHGKAEKKGGGIGGMLTKLPVLLGGVMIVFGVIDIYVTSVATAITNLVTVSGFLYSLFYAITGLAAAWFYRRFIGRSVKDALILGLMPIGGAALLLWVAYKGVIGLSSTEALILGGVGVVGVMMLIVARTVYKSPIFQIKAEAATTTEPTLHVGVD